MLDVRPHPETRAAGAGWPLSVRYEVIDVVYAPPGESPLPARLTVNEFAGESWQDWTQVTVAAYQLDEERRRTLLREPPYASDAQRFVAGRASSGRVVVREPRRAFDALRVALSERMEWTEPSPADDGSRPGPRFGPEIAALHSIPGTRMVDEDAHEAAGRVARRLNLEPDAVAAMRFAQPACPELENLAADECAERPQADWLEWRAAWLQDTKVPLLLEWEAEGDRQATVLRATTVRPEMLPAGRDGPGDDFIVLGMYEALDGPVWLAVTPGRDLVLWRHERTTTGESVSTTKVSVEAADLSQAQVFGLRGALPHLDEPRTLVAGPTTSGAHRVVIIPADGQPVRAELVDAHDWRWFVADLPGHVTVERIVALDADRNPVDERTDALGPPS